MLLDLCWFGAPKPGMSTEVVAAIGALDEALAA
jgi:hypothetical protein